MKILAIGNSFSVDGMEYLYQIATDLGAEKLWLGNLYYSGCSIEKHYSHLQSGTPAYTYYTNDNGVWNSFPASDMAAVLKSEKWDVITFQQSSSRSGLPGTYRLLPDLIREVKALCPDAKFVWHMTWAYQWDYSKNNFASYDNSQAVMYQAIVEAIRSQILSNGDLAVVIPVGTAIQNARTSYLGDTLTRDGYHLSRDIGRYIAGVTWAEALLGLDTGKLTFRPDGVDGNVMLIAVESAKNAVLCPYSVTESSYINRTENIYVNSNEKL